MSLPVVDSHLHLWDIGVSEYAWLASQPGDLRRSFLPEQARDQLSRAGVRSAILVQAEDSTEDTEWLLEVAGRFDFIAGVVGWVRLDEPGLAETQLARHTRDQAFKGVRHLVHDDPREEFLRLPGVRRSLALLAELGLPFDVPDAWPHHLRDVAQLATDLPCLTVVLDHLGKPPSRRESFGAWADAVREVARCPNTVAKVSGLHVKGDPFGGEALRMVWETALETFGPSRLMYGSDWPMTVPGGGYLPTWCSVSTLVQELSAAEQALVLHGTATSIYKIDVQE